MKYRFIENHCAEFPVNILCETLSIKRSAYYAWKRRPLSTHTRTDKKLLLAIKDIHQGHKRVYGSPRVTDELKDRGIRTSRKRVARLMRGANIRALTAKKFKVTTDSDHSLPVAPNILNRKFDTDAPNQVWLSDITYIYTQEKWLYLATVMDTYNREIVGWSLKDSMEASLLTSALKKTLPIMSM